MKITKNIVLKHLLAFFTCTISINATASDIVWFNETHNATYDVQTQVTPVVNVALDMFINDMIDVTGKKPLHTSTGRAVINIYELDMSSDKIKSYLCKKGVPVCELSDKTDGFYLAVIENMIYIVGNNGRGTAYGILELSRLAGVSPWIWWGDAVPEHKTQLTIDSEYNTLQSPSVEYRGIFINDEDWSFRRWSDNIEGLSHKYGFIGPKTYKHLFQLMLRLHANTLWPAMHPGTIPFFQVKGNKEVADSCGIIIGSSHCEPLLRNNVGEWNADERGRYNLITNRDKVLKYWTERLNETKGGEYLYTIGMRGIHDGVMEGVNTLREQVDGLQSAIDAQRILLSKYVNKDITKVPQVFVPYKEVLQIMENGLRIPDDVTLMWCDDNYGYLTRLSDSIQQKRSGGAGVYYHLSYWGRPHDYLWLTTTQPGLIYSEMKQAYDYNARKLWIANVHDPKVAAYDLQLFMDMAWNINSVSQTTIQQHLANWLCTQFGESAGLQLLPVMTEFYRLCSIRKPEFMGWSQTELDKNKYPRGLSPVQKPDFTALEAKEYLASYRKLKDTVAGIEKSIRPELRDAYFAAVKYPVFSAADMSIKMLDAENAMAAYKEIQSLTEYYNNKMSQGKWKYSMCASPRDLPVFGPPSKMTLISDTTKTINENPENNLIINASDYISATEGTQKIQMLGHSMNAVSLLKNGELSYNIINSIEGEAILCIALIPTQPNDRGDIRFSVSIDGGEPIVFSIKEPFRSEQWKLNVLSGQTVKQIHLNLVKGIHKLVIKALDDHLIIDRMEIKKITGV